MHVTALRMDKPMPSLDGARVLLLDDSRTMHSVYRQLLSGSGVAEIRAACDVAEALETCQRWLPDVALVDYELDDMSGGDFVKLIRTASDSPAPNMALVVVTSHGERRVVEEVMAAGADAFVVKPVNALQLVTRVRAALDKRRQDRRDTLLL